MAWKSNGWAGVLVGLVLAGSGPAATATGEPSGHHDTRYHAFASPAQESGPANGSPAKGRATITFDEFLTRARLDFRLYNLDPASITGFHIHCGLPGQLGPMIVNFGEFGDFTETFKNGRFSVTLENDDVVVAAWPPEPGELPEGCPSNVVQPGQSNTIAGLEALARQGALYFNLHTGQNPEDTYFYGLIRGQIYPAKE